MKQLDHPVPQGKYKPAIRHQDVIYTSGMTPRKAGKLIYSGKVIASNPLGMYQEAIRLATSNALNAACACLNENERITTILQLQVFINAEEGFEQHAKLADFASEFLMEKIGDDCIGTRAAIGVASLPGNASFEITLSAKTEIF